MEVEVDFYFHGSFHLFPWDFPWKLMEVSMPTVGNSN